LSINLATYNKLLIMDKFVKKNDNDNEDLGHYSDSTVDSEVVPDTQPVPSWEKPRRWNLDLGIIKFKDKEKKMYVGNKFVTFPDYDIYLSSAKHFCKNVQGYEEDDIQAPPLTDTQRMEMLRILKRGKRLITTHPKYKHRVLPLSDGCAYHNPIPPRKKRKKKPPPTPTPFKLVDYPSTGESEEEEDEVSALRREFVFFKEHYEQQQQQKQKQPTNEELMKLFGFTK